jgi:hypothetical protein
MIPQKPAPDLIRGGNRFSDKIMLKRSNYTGWSAAGMNFSATPFMQ